MENRKNQPKRYPTPNPLILKDLTPTISLFDIQAWGGGTRTPRGVRIRINPNPRRVTTYQLKETLDMPPNCPYTTPIPPTETGPLWGSHRREGETRNRKR